MSLNHGYTPKENPTEQEFYDECLRHLVRQGRPCMDPTELVGVELKSACKYRMPSEGKAPALACAVGHFIPDDLYNVEMENRIITVLLAGARWSKDIAKYLPTNSDRFNSLVRQLQCLHDNPKFWGPNGLNEQGKAEAHYVAVAHNLKPFNFSAPVQ